MYITSLLCRIYTECVVSYFFKQAGYRMFYFTSVHRIYLISMDTKCFTSHQYIVLTRYVDSQCLTSHQYIGLTRYVDSQCLTSHQYIGLTRYVDSQCLTSQFFIEKRAMGILLLRKNKNGKYSMFSTTSATQKFTSEIAQRT